MFKKCWTLSFGAQSWASERRNGAPVCTHQARDVDGGGGRHGIGSRSGGANPVPRASDREAGAQSGASAHQRHHAHWLHMVDGRPRGLQTQRGARDAAWNARIACDSNVGHRGCAGEAHAAGVLTYSGSVWDLVGAYCSCCDARRYPPLGIHSYCCSPSSHRVFVR